ncbi:MAG: MOSC N-terminal beta barrel domain-containing protein [Actinomycetota bacterium]
MRITELWRYPVKSMGGESLLDVEVDELGLSGDRGWGVFDLETGLTLTGRRTPELLMASSRLADGELVITLPDGTEVGDGDHDALSAWLGRDVELRAAGGAPGRFENPMNVVDETDWIEWDGPDGTFHDSSRSRFTLISTASLREWDLRRFRTNVVVDGSGEDELVGTRIGLGGADGVLADVTKRVDRCVMVTRPQPGLERDRSVLTTLRDESDLCLSVGCLVARPGRLALGADVVVA